MTVGMWCLTAFVVLAAWLPWSQCKLDRYCALCEDHTMCKYHGVGKDCVSPGGSGVSESDKREILQLHNWMRRKVAAGYETRGSGGSQPRAANLRKMLWDEELAKVAQMWADQCRFAHDSCRHDPRWHVGQNIYWKYKYPTHHVNWTEAIVSWYNEVSLFNPDEVDAYRFEPSTGHYTQVLWHETHLIGCGRKDYGYNKLYVCNYGPTGNWLGEPIYAVGEPCSKCPEGTVCDEYLCAPAKPTEKAETPTGGDLVDNNAIPVPAELTARTVNESTLETLHPPAAEPDAPLNQTQTNPAGDKKDRNLLTYVLLKAEDKPTANAVDGGDVELDADTRKEIERIKLGIENLVKSVIRKSKRKE